MREFRLGGEEHAEDDRGEAARPRPAEECDRRALGPGADQRERDRDHPHHGEAEHRVEHDLPVEVVQGGPDDRGSEDDERDRVQQLAALFEEVRDLAAGLAAESSEHQAADERRDEDAPSHPQGEPGSEHGRGERVHLDPGALGPAAPDREALDERRPGARGEAGQASVADLLDDQVKGRVAGHGRRIDLREADRDEEERHADAVVQAALDVQTLPDQRGQAWVGDDRLPERGIGAREADGEEERLRPVQAGEDPSADERARDDRQGQADAEQPQGDGVLGAERTQVDPRCIGEQDERERRLGEQLDVPVALRELDQAEPGAGDQAADGEEDRGRDEDALEPERRHRVREHDERDRRHRPVVHRSILAGLAVGA